MIYMTLFFRKYDFIWPNQNGLARTCCTTTVQRTITSESRDGSPIVCWNPIETNCTKYVVCFEENWNNAWTLVNFFGTRTCIFSYCITFYPNTSVHLRLSHHSQGDHVGSVCRMQLRPSLIVVSPENLRLFKGFLVGFLCKYAKHDFMI